VSRLTAFVAGTAAGWAIANALWLTQVLPWH
jgi:hypothetical protein